MEMSKREVGFLFLAFSIFVTVIVFLRAHPKGQQNTGPYRSCRDVPIKVSGKYDIRVNDKVDSFVAYCEQEKYGGGWMVIQLCSAGSLSFDRNWADYRNGFGDAEGEHWLGLEKVYQFTKERECELLVEMEEFDKTYKYARYDTFGIGSESEQYRLVALGMHIGTTGDSLTYNRGMKFSTPDRDNDNKDDVNCAQRFKGGWWFNDCGYAFLNGLYRNVSRKDEKIVSSYVGGSYDLRPLTYSRMLIRQWN